MPWKKKRKQLIPSSHDINASTMLISKTVDLRLISVGMVKQEAPGERSHMFLFVFETHHQWHQLHGRPQLN